MGDYEVHEAQRRVQDLLQELSNDGQLSRTRRGGLVSAFVLICEVVGPGDGDPGIVSFADEDSRMATTCGMLTLAQATLVRTWTDLEDDED